MVFVLPNLCVQITGNWQIIKQDKEIALPQWPK